MQDQRHHQLNYVEIPCRDLQATKAFFSQVFDWRFTDWGDEYSSFNQGLDGGFFKSDKTAQSSSGSALVVLYSESLEQTLSAVEEAGGTVVQAIFDFPGGRRFHFTDPSGNEFAVWSES